MYVFFKSTLDKFIALIVLLGISPLLLIIALFVALDGGRPIFTQCRLGKGMKEFRIFKFRTMIVDADEFLDINGMPTKERVTKGGRFLRKTSLDELPQLVNIIMGDMNFVGPRPVLCSWKDRFTHEQKKRFLVNPGVTGLAQIKGRNIMPWSQRLELDRLYVSKMNVFLDISILLKTVVLVLASRDVVVDRNSDKVDDL